MTENELRSVIIEHWGWYQAQFIAVDPLYVGDRDLVAAVLTLAHVVQKAASRLLDRG